MVCSYAAALLVMILLAGCGGRDGMSDTSKDQTEKSSGRNSSDFKSFLEAFLADAFSGKNFDSLVYASSPLVTGYIDSAGFGFGRYYNPGAACVLYSEPEFGYHFYEGYSGDRNPVIDALPFFPDQEPAGGFCEQANSPDGVYYQSISDLPQEWNEEEGRYVSASDRLKDFKKMKVEVLYDGMILKVFYFIQGANEWHLLYVDDCDCSA